MIRFANASIRLLAVLMFAALPAVAGTVLHADFDSQTVDQPIGTGGPTVGEPVSLSCVAVVRDTPFPSNCLEFDDEQDFGTAGAIFEFLNDVEVTEGTVEISLDFWFAEMEGYYYYTRQQGSASASFNTIYFQDDGDVISNDANGSLGTIAQYETGRSINLRIEHDLDAGTYDIWWDGALIIDDRAHGIVGHGVGGVYMGFDHDTDLDGIMYVDNIHVEASSVTSDEAGTWSGVKSAWR